MDVYDAERRHVGSLAADAGRGLARLSLGMLDLGFEFSWKWGILPHGNFQKERNDSP